MKHILVTGASITGPALAWWLQRHGFRVTVIERAPEFRDAGQNIDVRGAGREVIRRMGLEAAVKARNTTEEGTRVVDARGAPVATFRQQDYGANGPTAELEILRGDLARLLFEASRETVEYVFGRHVAALDEDAGGVEVALDDGSTRRFDLVLVAEGIGSSTRQRVFGPGGRTPFDLYIGYFTIPRTPTDDRLWRIHSAGEGRQVGLRPDNKGTTRALLSVQQPSNGVEHADTEAQKRFLTERFAGAGWETPRILDGLQKADDFYFEAVGQIHLDRWSRGRVALVGDAAYAPAPISGMGTSLGLAGAYVLAGELARHADHAAAFARYEDILRPYVEQGQDVPRWGPKLMHPQTDLGVSLQHVAAAALATRPLRAVTARLLEPPAEKIELPDYG